MTDIVVDRVITEVGMELDKASFRKAVEAQQALRKEADKTSTQLSGTVQELKKLEAEEAKAARQTQALRQRQLQLRQEIARQGKATADQRRQLAKTSVALTKSANRTKGLRQRSQELRRSQGQLRSSLAKTRAESKRLGRALLQAGRSASRAKKEMRGAFGEKAAAAAGRSAQGVGRVASVAARAGAGVAVLGGAVLKTAADFERLQAQLVAVTGSEALASAAFERILTLAKDTPFQVQNITAAFSRLQAVGIKPTDDLLKSLANTSAANSKDILDFAEAIADASTGEFERLKEFGIVGRKSGEEVRLTFDGVTTSVKNNKDEITAFLQEIGENRFAGAAAQQMDTIGGRVSNLQDQLGQLALRIGEMGVSGGFKDLLTQVSELLADPAVADQIANFLNEGLAQLSAILKDIEARGGLAPLLKTIFGALSNLRKIVVSVVEAGVALADFLKDFPGVVEAATVALIAFNVAGGGIPGMVAAAGVALGLLAANYIEVGLAASLARDQQLAFIQAQRAATQAQIDETQRAADAVKAQTKDTDQFIKGVQKEREERVTRVTAGATAGGPFVRATGEEAQFAAGRIEAAETTGAQRQAAQAALFTSEGAQVFAAIDKATARQVDLAEATARREARRSGRDADAAARTARASASKAAQESRAKAVKSAESEFARTGSAAQAARAGASAVGGKKKGRGGGGRAGGATKRATSPIEALQQALSRPPVINITNNQVNVTGAQFTAEIEASFQQGAAFVAQSILGEFRTMMQQVFAEALSTVSTTRVR